MSEVDPAALSRPDLSSRASETPAVPSKTLPNGNHAPAKAPKAVPATPRVDLEPFYAEIKAAIGDNWVTYKDALSRFVLGGLNQTELSTAIEPYIFTDPKRENLHNQLICGLYTNIFREAPDAPVAPWVSANDKPTAAPKPPSGDPAEQRLKQEIMLLPARIRHRIKNIRDDPYKPLTTHLFASARSHTLHNPTATAAPITGQPPDPTAPTPTDPLNHALDIRRRYNLPLASEVHDLPSANALTERVLPVAYEEGLGGGIGDQRAVGELLENALSIWTKDLLADWIGRTASDLPTGGLGDGPVGDVAAGAVGAGLGLQVNGANGNATPGNGANPAAVTGAGEAGWGGLPSAQVGVKTSGYKRKLKGEEGAQRRGLIKRSGDGQLSTEVEMSRGRKKRKIDLEDVMIAWRLGDETLKGTAPWSGERMLLDYSLGRWEGGDEGYDDQQMDGVGEVGKGGGEGDGDLDLDVEDGDGRRLLGLPPLKSMGARSGAGVGVGRMGTVVLGRDVKKKGRMVNGVTPVVNGVNGINGHMGEAVDVDEDFGWQGARKADRAALDDLLDDCLDF